MPPLGTGESAMAGSSSQTEFHSQEFILLGKGANFVELAHYNGFNSPSMVGINSETVG